MAAILRQSSSHYPGPKMSPLKQHPVSTAVRSTSPDATQTIFLNHPSARLSSSPASSPRIIESTPVSRGSVHPAMSKTMEKGLEPGADFFDDGSSDSQWEDRDDDVTQTFSAIEGLGFGGSGHAIDDDEEHGLRGRSWERSVVTALPSLPTHDSGLGIDEDHLSSPTNGSGTKKAREMSLKRLGKNKVRLVHTLSTSGTPKGSLRSNGSEKSLPLAEIPKSFPNPKSGEESAGLPRSHSFKGRHRRDTSESVIADSIIDAHVMTMRALESLSPSGSLSHSAPRVPKSASFTHDRHITLAPRSAADHECPPHLPNHFIKTPYLFTAKKEFPKPKSRPRRQGEDGGHKRDTAEESRPDSSSDEDTEQAYNDRKGKHILGMLMPSEGEYDLRSRLERNRDAQGIICSMTGSEKERAESAIWLTLQKGMKRKHHVVAGGGRLFRVSIPNPLTTSSPDRSMKGSKRSAEIDFDDMFFAERLRAGYRSLAGSWFTRTFGARTLSSIQLARSILWSGSTVEDDTPITSGLLASGDGLPGAAPETKSPFTEAALMNLFKRPETGKARYTWVHWARRVATSNNHTLPQSCTSPCEKHIPRRRAHSLDSPQKHTDTGNPKLNRSPPFPFPSSGVPSLPDFITTIHFTRSLSPTRIFTVLAFMLTLSIAAALLWIFLGTPGTGWRTGVGRARSERVGSGMAVGILVLLVEGVGFGSWVWVS